MSQRNTNPISTDHNEFGYMRLPELKQLLQCSASTIWRKSRDGSFPAPIKLSAGITCWSRQAVAIWLKEKGATQ